MKVLSVPKQQRAGMTQGPQGFWARLQLLDWLKIMDVQTWVYSDTLHRDRENHWNRTPFTVTISQGKVHILEPMRPSLGG